MYDYSRHSSRRIIGFAFALWAGLLCFSNAGAQCSSTNIALGKMAVANLDLSYAAAATVTDGDMSTAWASDQDGMKWIYVDLGQPFNLCKVILKWYQGTGISGLRIQGSNTAANDWVDLVVTGSNDYGQVSPDNSYTYNDIDLSSTTTAYRYVRLYISFAGAWGPKVREFEIYPRSLMPTVSLISPASGSNFVQGSNIGLSATATEQGGSISKVEFYQGSTLLGQVVSNPYQFTWNNVPAGDYSLTAKAYDASNVFAISSPVNIHVGASSSWFLNGNAGNAASVFLGTTDNQPVIFKTNGLERLRLTTDGKVGINTAASIPTDASLAVNGYIYARRLKITQGNWPDYVFSNNYKLLSLKDLEDYINRHHHLPAVPSAVTAKKEGIDVGDNQAVLLQKIEELTLYIIQLNKEVQELKNKNGDSEKAKERKPASPKPTKAAEAKPVPGKPDCSNKITEFY